MKETDKDKLEKLETLREQALFAPEEVCDEAQANYEELRDQLFCVDTDDTTEQTKQTQALPIEEQTLICESCGEQFTYAVAGQQSDQGRSIGEPKICVDCRRNTPLDKSERKGEGKSSGTGGFNS